MAEESPRPESGEDSEEGEEGEEAAEAPVLEKKKEEAPVSEEEEEQEAAATPEPPPPPEEEEEKKQASTARQPLLPTPPAFPLTMPAYPAYYTPAAPAFPSTTPGVNVFANDGSFLELFKKKMEQGPTGSKEEATATPEEKKPPEPEKRKPISFVGRRRGGAKLALKTGLVAKKPKTDEEEVVVQKGGAWAQYMAEVKKYKAHQCSDDDKTRPLVK
ncbi:telomerase RNA component interacting RNase [Lithobates pipiens]